MGLQLQMSWQPSLLSQKRKNGPPLGLRNLGNSCYLNSVLQCLTYTPPLANFCLANQHSSLCDSAADAERKRDCPFCILEKRIARSLSVDLALDSPAKIVNCLRIFAEHLKCGRQEDAHEFLRYVIDACHNTCLRLKKLRRKGTEPFNGNNTVVKEIFGGALQSQVECLSCGALSNKVDDIMDISLEIMHSSSLQESIQKFFQPEILDGNNKYRCDNCKKLVKARKQMSIHQAPNILVIQLKRFEGIFGGKIDKVIAFEEVLVLSNVMSKASQDPQPVYNLFGTIVHSGFSPESGHYYAYIKDAMGRWYCCNDSYVSLSTQEEVLSEKVYILFFSRANQRPLSAGSALASNGVKHFDGGSEIPKAQKAGLRSKEVNTKTNDTSGGSRIEKVLSSQRTKFNISQNINFKRVPAAVNGKLGAHKGQNLLMNGNIKDSHHIKRSEKDVSLTINKNGSNRNRKDEVSIGNSSSFGLVNENGSIQTKYSAKTNHHEGNGTSSSVTRGSGFCYKEVENGNSQSDLSGSRRKSELGSCSLLGQDAQSQEKRKVLKEILQKEAYLVLQSCGWSEEVHNFMRTRKKLCTQEGGNSLTDSDLKKKLIADAKSTFTSQIPESLKANLIKQLRSFSQEKQDFLHSGST